ncbi:MAG: hypothetical protein AAGA00_04990 [Pseudomonadota bacterium]
MKKLAASLAVACMAVFCAEGAKAADFDPQAAIQELVVSGYVESWTGYTFLTSLGGENAVGGNEPDPQAYFASNVSGRLSLPLGDTLSLQTDVGLEYTENAFDDDDSEDVFESGFYLGGHLTHRDPSAGAFGVFAAFGASRTDEDNIEFYAVGGEGQVYLNDVTLYLQGGYFDAKDGEETGVDRQDPLHNAFFVRGVGRWFLSPDSRFQAEVSYAAGDQGAFPTDDMYLIEWGVRFDTVLHGLPVIGDTPVFAGYRGARFDNEGIAPGIEDGQTTEHTIMVGFTHAFGGNSMQEFDRVGATLDLPGFARWVGYGENLD